MSFENIATLFEEAPIMTYLGYFTLFNFGLIFIEIMLDLFTSKERRWKDTGANIVIFIINQLLENTVYGILGILFLIPISWLTPFDIPFNVYTWVLAVIVADLSYYWIHRLEHQHRILWAGHSVHHSSEDYNLSISLRLSFVEGLYHWIFLIPMVLIGFSPFMTIVSMIIVLEYQTWIHTEKITKLGWLDEVFNTPSVHRVHHGSNKDYLDKNYGGILMIWDKMFGTFQREKEKVVYGLTKNIKTNNPITINFIEYKNIWNDVKKCRNWKDRLKIIFGGLTWRPDYFDKQKKVSTSGKQ